MKAEIDGCGAAADALAAVDLSSLSRAELAAGALALTRHLDRMRALHASVLAEADRAQVWLGSGARNLADWLAQATGVGYGELVGRVRLGDTLEASPELAAAVSAGEVSAATAETLFAAVCAPPPGAPVPELVEAVRGATPAAAKVAVETWRRQHAPESPEAAEDRAYRQRSVRFSAPVDGLVTATATLPTLDARRLRRCLGAIAGKPAAEDTRTTEQRLADGLVQLCAAYAKGDVRGGREQASLLVIGTAETWAGLSDDPGRTAEGDVVPAHVLRHLAEDARIQRVITAGAEALELGRSTRFATDEQWRALVIRDQCCRWLGCRIPAAWCDVDHIVAWEDGGLTDLDNLELLCRHHHIEKHRPGVQVSGDAATLQIHLPSGVTIDCSLRRTSAAA